MKAAKPTQIETVFKNVLLFIIFLQIICREAALLIEYVTCSDLGR